MSPLIPETIARGQSAALKHSVLETMLDPEDEPSFEGAIDFTFEEDHSLNLEKVKRLILK